MKPPVRRTFAVISALFVAGLGASVAWSQDPGDSRSSEVRSLVVDAAGLRLHVLEAGPSSDQALLLLHGGRFRADTWRSIHTLETIAATGRRVIALDLPGFGQTPAGKLDWTATLDALDLRRLVVLSPSMSGRFSFPLLLEHPERLAGFVAAAPVGIQDAVRALDDCEVPLLAVWGDQDTTVPPRQAALLCTAFRDAHTVMLQGAGHPSYLEQPGRFHAELIAFLDRVLPVPTAVQGPPDPASTRAQDQPEPVLPVDDLGDALLQQALPAGFPEPLPAPAGNEHSAQRFGLGRRLFFDPILSIDHTVSCASCHQPEYAFASPEALPLGVQGQRCKRNAPTLFNRAFAEPQMWDGRVQGLEAQVLMPVEAPNEMGLPLDQAVQRLRDHDEYPELFQAAYGSEPGERTLSFALAAFVRRLWLGDSPVDLFRAADVRHLDREAKQGLWVFESRGGCWKCHNGPNFSDESFHNTGVGVEDGVPLPGRFAITGQVEDTGRFRTPTLRGLTGTAPYMHDGSLQTLGEVVEFYRGGGGDNPHRDPALAPLSLSDEDARHLVAFLRALSSTVPASQSGAAADDAASPDAGDRE